MGDVIKIIIDKASIPYFLYGVILGLLLGGWLMYLIFKKIHPAFLISTEKRIRAQHKVIELYTAYKNQEKTLEEIHLELLRNIAYLLSRKKFKILVAVMHCVIHIKKPVFANCLNQERMDKIIVPTFMAAPGLFSRGVDLVKMIFEMLFHKTPND